ncbi:hypothetical protein EYB53_016425 [Candidatus Chloroploca sp. M-50]|uniref:Zinc-finger domain-containing protein n=1 Tax=Candidatus Chloroploca mongolica TaxID=2528176 RepID=A0ABS4DCX5_9CHLR|nr:hypothetical protein [Candidatus Chloroploca mongolica]MBP1467300.1 hypothetical protein [Candidatus Chloroploca mongolica]
MNLPSCNDIREALLLTLTSTHKPLQTPAIARHMRRCPECMALRTHILGLLLPGADEPRGGCQACHDALAAYVDRSLDAGARAAAVAFPQVWWYLWECADCTEVFVRTSALATAEREGRLLPPFSSRVPVRRPVPSPPRPHRLLGRIAVPSQMVVRMIQAREALSVAYGDDEDLFITEVEQEGYSFQLSVHPQTDGTWAIRVCVIPPVVGHAVVQLGVNRYQAPFDAQGIAQVIDLSAEQLRQDQGTLMVMIEMEE